MIEGSTIAVWFSCGAASAVAAKKAIELYGNNNIIRVLNNPVLEEHEDNRRFLKDVEKWIGVEVETIINKKYPNASAVEIWEKRKYMSGVNGAPCTYELKKKARQDWESLNNVDWHVLGFTAEEKHRHDRFILSERKNVIPILIDQNIGKTECMQIIKSAGIALPKIYSIYSNANCIGCSKASSATYWNLTREHFPDVFMNRSEQSRRLGARLVKWNGKRIFLDELPKNARSRPLKDHNIECGLFCEERDD